MTIYNVTTDTVPVSTYEPIPAGKYLAMIESERHYRAKSNRNNIVIDFKIRILEGKYKNRVLWYKNHACNTSPKAREIGVEQLQIIAGCVGYKRGFVLDTDQVENPSPWFAELFNHPLMIDVRLQETPDYGVQNIIRGFSVATSTSSIVVEPTVTPVTTTTTIPSPETNSNTTTTGLKQEDFQNLWGDRAS